MAEQVWFITGASRGMGVEFALATRRAGHSVVATGRNAAATADALGDHDRLLVVALDVTDPDQVDAAVASALDRFGRIDVLVNNAGSSFKGYFEEMSAAQVEAQLATNLLGPMNVTRAVLPSMRVQRRGHVISISSGAGLYGFEYSSVYAASKAGLEGWMTALRPEIAPFGIHATIVNPGWFRTGLAGPESLVWPELAIDDYSERSAVQQAWWRAQDGRQPGDPRKLAEAVVGLAAMDRPPDRFLAGGDVFDIAERKIAELQAAIDAFPELSTSLTVDEP